MDQMFQEGIEQFITYERNDDGKLTRRQKKREKIARMVEDLNDPEKKKERHLIRRQQEKQKLKKQLEGFTLEETKAYLQAKKHKKKQIKQKLMAALQTGLPILIDAVYESKMNPKENKSLAIQIQLIMKTIKNMENPPGIHLCSIHGFAKGQLERMGYQHWTLTSSSENIIEVSKKLGKKPVYLSPDAPEPLLDIDSDITYVIGGLVDRTVIKNASLTRAKQLGIPAYHLPIRQMMKNRTCLNLDHVVMILCKFKQTKDWKAAFEFGAPKRWKRQQSKQQYQSDNKQQCELDNRQQQQGRKQ